MTSPAVLLIDAGSSRLKWAWWRDGSLINAAGLSHHGDAATAVAMMAEGGGVDRVLLTSVLDDAAENRLTDALVQRFGIRVESARSAAECCGVRNGYLIPEQLGVDRWLALVAAHRPGFRTLVVDCGTAVTLDAVDEAGNHLGGQILPGLAAMGRALRASTRLDAESAQSAGLFGRNTAACIGAGIHHAIASLIDRVATTMVVNEEPPRVIMTGGDAGRIARLLGSKAEIRPLLVLEGLASYAGLTLGE